ncbi:MAG: hypothetical protein FWF63_00715 [Fibromonadales bacterium]|nr:hypothetical protein [Fibromonadales bacterium]
MHKFITFIKMNNNNQAVANTVNLSQLVGFRVYQKETHLVVNFLTVHDDTKKTGSFHFAQKCLVSDRLVKDLNQAILGFIMGPGAFFDLDEAFESLCSVDG